MRDDDDDEEERTTTRIVHSRRLASSLAFSSVPPAAAAYLSCYCYPDYYPEGSTLQCRAVASLSSIRGSEWLLRLEPTVSGPYTAGRDGRRAGRAAQNRPAGRAFPAHLNPAAAALLLLNRFHSCSIPKEVKHIAHLERERIVVPGPRGEEGGGAFAHPRFEILVNAPFQ